MKPAVPDLSPNWGYLSIFLWTTFWGGFTIGYALSYTNNASELLNQKYDWETEESKSWHQSLVGASLIAGMAIGAFIGSKLMSWSRRYSFIIAALVAIVGSGLTLIVNIWALYLGRLIYGISAGMCSVIISRY